MTLIAAWVRSNGPVSELVVASDSRLDSGELWDWSPKTLVLPRPATVAAVAGAMDTAYAYLVQSVWTAQTQTGSSDGRTSLSGYARQLFKVLRPARTDANIKYPMADEDIAPGELLLGGWNWRTTSFQAYHFMPTKVGLQMEDAFASGRALEGVYFAGSGAKGARRRLLNRLRALSPDGGPLIKPNWEPLEVLQAVIRDRTVRDVGGPIQIVRVYQYGIAEPLMTTDDGGTYWVGGRVLTERSDLRAIAFSRGADGRLIETVYFPPEQSLRADGNSGGDDTEP